MYSSFQYNSNVSAVGAFIFILQCHPSLIHHTSLQRQLLYSSYPHEQKKCSDVCIPDQQFSIKTLSKRAYFLIAVGALYSIFMLQCHLFIIQACSGSCCIQHTLMNRRNIVVPSCLSYKPYVMNRRNVAMFVFQFSILVVFILKYCQKEPISLLLAQFHIFIVFITLACSGSCCIHHAL